MRRAASAFAALLAASLAPGAVSAQEPAGSLARHALLIVDERPDAPSAEETGRLAEVLAAGGFEVLSARGWRDELLQDALARFLDGLAAADGQAAAFVYIEGRASWSRDGLRLLPPEGDDPAAAEGFPLRDAVEALEDAGAELTVLALDLCGHGSPAAEDCDLEPLLRRRPMLAAVASGSGGEPGDAAARLAEAFGVRSIAIGPAVEQAAAQLEAASDGARRLTLAGDDAAAPSGTPTGGQPRLDRNPRRAAFFYVSGPPAEDDREARIAESMAWDAARLRGGETAFRTYLEAYPNGRFSGRALRRIAGLDDAVTAEPDPDRRRPDLEDVLALQTAGGSLLIEMSPAIAPEIVARVRELAREGWFTGRAFDQAAADRFSVEFPWPEQDGLPPNRTPPWLAPVEVDAGAHSPSGEEGAATAALYRGVPFVRRDGEAWAAHCPGLVTLARPEVPGEEPRIVVLIQGAPDLDRAARPWGRIVANFQVLVGVPVVEMANGATMVSRPDPAFAPPDRIEHAFVLGDDWPPPDARLLRRTGLSQRDETGPGFADFVKARAGLQSEGLDLCAVAGSTSSVSVVVSAPDEPWPGLKNAP